jgi:hypothetical protein
MAHECPVCGLTCHCGGDISDLLLNIESRVNRCQHCGPDEDEPEENYCPHCGKSYEDFSDLGCGRCDSRCPEFGIKP